MPCYVHPPIWNPKLLCQNSNADVSLDSIVTLAFSGLTLACNSPGTLCIPGLRSNSDSLDCGLPLPRYPCVRVSRDSIVTLTVPGLTVAYHPPRYPCVRVSLDSVVTLTVPGLTVAYHPTRYPCVRVSRDSIVTPTVPRLTVAYHPTRYPCVRISRDSIVTLTVLGVTVAYSYTIIYQSIPAPQCLLNTSIYPTGIYMYIYLMMLSSIIISDRACTTNQDEMCREIHM